MLLLVSSKSSCFRSGSLLRVSWGSGRAGCLGAASACWRRLSPFFSLVFSLGLWMALLATSHARAATFSHDTWDALLQQHVAVVNQGLSTRANYAGFKKDKVKLDAYLAELSAVSKSTFSSWPKAEQLAFLINVYNAFTIDLILTIVDPENETTC